MLLRMVDDSMSDSVEYREELGYGLWLELEFVVSVSVKNRVRVGVRIQTKRVKTW